MNKNPIKNSVSSNDLRIVDHSANRATQKDQESWPAQRPGAPVSQTRSGQTGLRRNAAPLGHAPDIAQESGHVVHLDCGGGRLGSAAPAPAAVPQPDRNHPTPAR